MRKYLGVTYGRIIEGFCIIPSINLNWARFADDTFLICGGKTKKKEKIKKYYDLQFAWLFWYFTIGTIHKRLKEMQ